MMHPRYPSRLSRYVLWHTKPEQDRVFASPFKDKRLVVVAANVAEASGRYPICDLCY